MVVVVKLSGICTDQPIASWSTCCHSQAVWHSISVQGKAIHCRSYAPNICSRWYGSVAMICRHYFLFDSSWVFKMQLSCCHLTYWSLIIVCSSPHNVINPFWLSLRIFPGIMTSITQVCKLISGQIIFWCISTKAILLPWTHQIRDGMLQVVRYYYSKRILWRSVEVQGKIR